MPTANSNGYSSLSVALHWLGAFCVIVLFITHEGARGSTAYAIHVGGGALMGVVLLWRVWNRISKGKPERPKQHALLNLLADVVLWGLLAAVFIVTVTGYVLPWSLGQPLDIFEIVSVPSPMGRSPGLHEFVEELHDISGHLIVPLVLLHVAGALKHAFLDRDGILQRMLRPVSGGH